MSNVYYSILYTYLFFLKKITDRCEQLSNTAVDTINFIDSMDKLFDIFNSHPLSKDISDINIDGLKRYKL